jgi:hypothetical protein
MRPVTQHCHNRILVSLMPKKLKLEMRQREPAELSDRCAAERAKTHAFQRLRLACYTGKRELILPALAAYSAIACELAPPIEVRPSMASIFDFAANRQSS